MPSGTPRTPQHRPLLRTAPCRPGCLQANDSPQLEGVPAHLQSLPPAVVKYIMSQLNRIVNRSGKRQVGRATFQEGGGKAAAAGARLAASS